MDETKIEVNGEYVAAQLARALDAVARAQDASKSDASTPDTSNTYTSNPDTINRSALANKQAKLKLAKWIRVVSGMLTGQLQIGSRLPVSDVPAWATLEIAQGGFATGRLLAEGDIQEHERQLAARLSIADGITVRAALNAYFLSPEGQAELKGMLSNKLYRIEVPEESALLVVTYLLDHGDSDAAQDILQQIAPFFSRLRFYPTLSREPMHASTLVHLQNIAKTGADFANVKGSMAVEKQRQALLKLPLYDQAVSLFAETVVDGWPCQQYPDGWMETAASLLAEVKKSESQQKFAPTKSASKRNAARLFAYLRLAVNDRTALSGRDVGMIRAILQHVEAARGLPGSAKSKLLRAEQRAIAARPGVLQFAQVVSARLAKVEREALSSISDIFYPITDGESNSSKTFESVPLFAGCPLPESFRVKLLRSVEMPLNELVESKLVSSSEQLAPVLTQISAQLQARSFTDSSLQTLYAATYSAFRRRRSLLLFQLAKQVQLSELPWVSALDRYNDGTIKDLSREKLSEICAVNFKSFPQQILPNKLISEIGSLAKRAGLTLPLVEELAADIFMGEFSPKYTQAAALTAKYLKGTIYDRYYGLSDFVDDRVKNSFAKLCKQRAGDDSSKFSVAANGKIIEQEQIFTSHNLAALFSELKLHENQDLDLEELVKTCFVWICQQHQSQSFRDHSQLSVLKNTAYAWRQMIFFLSLIDAQKQAATFIWMEEYLLKQKPDFVERFSPLLGSLKLAQSESIKARQRFLGWTTK